MEIIQHLLVLYIFTVCRGKKVYCLIFKDVPQQSRQRQEHRPQQPAPSDLKPIALRATQDIFRASGLADKEEVPETTEDDLKMFQSYAAPIFPPYVTKEDEGA